MLLVMFSDTFSISTGMMLGFRFMKIKSGFSLILCLNFSLAGYSSEWIMMEPARSKISIDQVGVT